jgi:predicted transcriptional regulator
LREILVSRLVALLKSKGFEASTFFDSNSCFDLAARGPNGFFVLKVLENIDGFREEQAAELKKISSLFRANAFLVGEKSKSFSLQAGTVYERYGVNALNIETFEGLLAQALPSERYFKGKRIVEIDSRLLRQRRQELGLSLRELAEKTGLSLESIHRFEKGRATSAEKAKELEGVLGTQLVKKIDLLQESREEIVPKKELFAGELKDKALEKVHDLGIELAVFQHAPFKSATEPEESLLISKGIGKTDLAKKALRLSKTRKPFGTKPMLIAKDFKPKKIGEVPIVEEEELSTLSKPKDLLRLLKERERLKNG